MVKKNILPKGVRLDTDGPRTLMNTLAGAYAPLGLLSIKGMRYFPPLIKTESLMNTTLWSLISLASMILFLLETSYVRLE